MVTIWNNNVICFLILAISSFSVGLILGDIQRILPFVTGSYVVAAVLAVLAYLSPALIFGGPHVVIDIGILGSAGPIIINSFIGLPLCFFVAFLGGYIGDSFLP